MRYIRNARWSPDGRSILVRGYDAENVWGLYLVDLLRMKTAPVVQETERGVSSISSARWLPNGRGIVYMRRHWEPTRDPLTGKTRQTETRILWRRELDTGREAWPRPGEPATDFTGRDINPGSPTFESVLSVADLYAEGGLLLNFMASWFPPCRQELPDLQEIHASGEVPVLLVSASERQGLPPLATLVEGARLTMPVFYMPREEGRERLNPHYGRPAIPTTYLIDRSGTVREVGVGATSARAFRSAIEKHLSGG